MTNSSDEFENENKLSKVRSLRTKMIFVPDVLVLVSSLVFLTIISIAYFMLICYLIPVKYENLRLLTLTVPMFFVSLNTTEAIRII